MPERSNRRGGRSAAHLAWWLAATAAVTALVIAVGAAPVAAGARPYWVGDFRDGTYCQFATVFESTSVNAHLSSWGGLPACPGYEPYSRDPSQRVHLTRRPRPPRAADSRWASRHELRVTDGPWFAGFGGDKSTIRLTTGQTMNGPFRMGAVRWFRFSFYLPNPGFNWPKSGWYDLAGLHNTVRDPSGADWGTIRLIVTPGSGNPRHLAVALDGARAHANYEEVKLLQLTGARGSRAQGRIRGTYDRWHTLIVGVKFSSEGSVGRSPGWVRIVFDGRRVYARHRPDVWARETGVWLQLQNYKSHAAAFVDGATSSTVYFADARIGYSRAAVGG